MGGRNPAVENMELILDSFKDKKVFVTGHTGFKGSWLTYLLDKAGAFTKGYALAPSTSPSLYQNLEFSEKHSSVVADIRDADLFKEEINSFQPDYIFHLAAQPLVLESYQNPKETFETNFNGTLNLLEILREIKLDCTAILITTDKVYQNLELNKAFCEDDSLGGNDPYSASKASCEILIHAYVKSYFEKSKTRIASVRAGNVIGGGDWSENRLIPDIIRSSFEGAPLEIRNPKATRPWQHVIEALVGYLQLALQLSENPSEFRGAWNFGPDEGDVKSVEEILEISLKLGLDLELIESNNKHLHEAHYLKLDNTKAKKKLMWIPFWNSETTIERTIDWYRNFYNGIPATELMKKDISKYKLTK